MAEEVKAPYVSILNCSKDRQQGLSSLATNLQRTRVNYFFEILLVEETDQRCPIDGTTYVSHPIEGRGIPYARNLAFEHARGQVIVFLDDDCKIHDRWLDELLTPFRDETVVGVQGGVTVPRSTRSIGWAETILDFPGGGLTRVFESKGRIIGTPQIFAMNCAYPKWVFEKVGGFDERLRHGGDDHELSYKIYGASRKIRAVSDARVEHIQRSRIQHLIRQSFGFGSVHPYEARYFTSGAIVFNRCFLKIERNWPWKLIWVDLNQADKKLLAVLLLRLIWWPLFSITLLYFFHLRLLVFREAKRQKIKLTVFESPISAVLLIIKSLALGFGACLVQFQIQGDMHIDMAK